MLVLLISQIEAMTIQPEATYDMNAGGVLHAENARCIDDTLVLTEHHFDEHPPHMLRGLNVLPSLKSDGPSTPVLLILPLKLLAGI